MKKWIFILVLGWMINGVNAQCDYTTPRYNVIAELDVFYGVDTLFNGEPDSLFLNIYKPDNAEVDRPMIIWCFGGGFFAGTRQDFDDVCQLMAAQGYVAVTIDYRLGYIRPGGLNYPFAIDFREVPRAGYRAMQDLKGAIRFMKARYEEDGIDLDNVYIGGGSAGAITALAAAFLDEESEKDDNVLGDLGPSSTSPPIDRPDLGPVEGRLHIGEHDASVAGIVNIFGAVFDTTQITADDDEVIYSYHQDNDPVVPCGYNKAYWAFPFVPINMPYGYGSCQLDEHFNNLNKPEEDFETYIHPGAEHAIHDNDLIFSEVFNFLEYHICDLRVSNSDLAVEDIHIYPNPAQDFILVEGWPEGEPIGICSMLGEWLQWSTLQGGMMKLNHLPAGHYLVGNGQVMKKVIITP